MRPLGGNTQNLELVTFQAKLLRIVFFDKTECLIAWGAG